MIMKRISWACWVVLLSCSTVVGQTQSPTVVNLNGVPEKAIYINSAGAPVGLNSDASLVIIRVRPRPTPTPTPIPTPSGPVVTQPVDLSRIYATLYYPTGDRISGTLRTSDVADQLAKVGVVWHAIDSSSRRVVGGIVSGKTILQEQNLESRYAPVGGPVIFLQDSHGNVLRGPDGKEQGTGVITSIPSDPKWLVDEIKAIRGGK